MASGVYGSAQGTARYDWNARSWRQKLFSCFDAPSRVECVPVELGTISCLMRLLASVYGVGIAALALLDTIDDESRG